jgi:hypothetical protein
MLVDVLYMVRSDPKGHLGRRSLDRLRAFGDGYSQFQPFREFRGVGEALRNWILDLYRVDSDAVRTLNSYGILRRIAPDDESAFDLFFQSLDAVLAANPDLVKNPEMIGDRKGRAPLPVSSFLNTLTTHPYMLLGNRLEPGILRAFLDGYRLACLENGFIECADLDGFEHWIRRKLVGVRGVFRWENVVLSEFQGREEQACIWAIEELRNFRASLGPFTGRNCGADSEKGSESSKERDAGAEPPA